MLDELRGNDEDMDFMDDEDVFAYEEEEVEEQGLFLGMTAIQRFVIAIMLLFMICILSSFCLLVTERISLPFL